MSQTVVLGANRGLTRGFARLVAAPFVFLRVPPNALTMLGFLLSFVPAYFASERDWLWAAVALFIVSGFDMVDGAVARGLGRESRFGGYLDSVLDRASDLVVLFGIGFGLDTRPAWLLIGACVLTSFLTSYARARSHQDASPPPSTWNQSFERPERVLFLVLSLLLAAAAPRLGLEIDPLPWLLLIYALLGLWTVLARVHKVRQILVQTSK